MVTAVVLTKNEETNISSCLNGLAWCDECIVIDDNSDDRTIELARKKGAIVFKRALNGDFASQRNYGLSKAKSEWVLFIDADERVSSALWYEIMQHTNNPSNIYKGFYLKRKDIIWNKEITHGEIGTIKLLRLGLKESGLWEGNVHEEWKLKGRTLILNNPLNHYPHSSVSEFLRHINYYTNLRANELYAKKVKVYWWSVVLYPGAKFFLNYVIRAGFIDGVSGLIVAILMSFHSFLVRGKLWLLWNKK